MRVGEILLPLPSAVFAAALCAADADPDAAIAKPLAGRLGASGAGALLHSERQHGQSRVTGENRRGVLVAAQAYEDLVLKQWWTCWTAAAYADGLTVVRASHIRHRVTVNGKQLIADLQRAPGSNAVEIQ